jgi:serine/threonine protein kinase
MIAVDCPHCGCRLKVKDEWSGKKGKCPQCQQAVLVAASQAAALSDTKTLVPNAGTLADTDAALKTIPPAPSGGPPADPQAAAGGSAAPGHDFLASAEEPGELGRLGSYRILKVLGTGGMGIVFAAEDCQLKRAVALKVMLPTLAAIPSNRERFTREAQLAAAIEHDHIVAIYQVGEDRGVPFMAMPLLQGQTLEDRLRQPWEIPVAEVLRIGRETAEGLAAAHERGLVHRDIKPANIWLEGPRQRVKILDFGLARPVADNTTLTQTGTILGTPSYMAPEQARGKGVGPASDLFSLGCVLYHMGTGELPFKGTDTISMLAALAMDTPEPPRRLNPQLPAGFNELVMQLLTKDPRKRPASADAVVTMIRAIEDGQPVSAPKPEAPVIAIVPPAEADDNRQPRRKPVEAPRAKWPKKAPTKKGSRAKWIAWAVVAASIVTLLPVGILLWVNLQTKPFERSGTLAGEQETTVIYPGKAGQLVYFDSLTRDAPKIVVTLADDLGEVSPANKDNEDADQFGDAYLLPRLSNYTLRLHNTGALPETYRFRLVLLEKEAKQLVPGNSTTSAISDLHSNVYRFAGRTGLAYVGSATNAAGVKVKLLDARGKMLGSSWDSPRLFYTLPLRGAGTYYLVFTSETDGAYNYEFRLR